MRKILGYSILGSFGTAFYITAIVSFMYYCDKYSLLGENLLIPIFFLMLFVFSAAFTGFLILGKPIMLYADGKKRDAVVLFFSTIILFFMIAIVVFLISSLLPNYFLTWA